MDKLGYTFYPKDFISDPDVMMMTSSERGIYRDLIDLAYMSGNKIKYNLTQLAKYCNDSEQSVSKILSLKAKKSGDHWEIPSCERRIKKAEVSRGNGTQGGRPKKPNGNPEQNLNGTQSKRQREIEREREEEREKELFAWAKLIVDDGDQVWQGMRGRKVGQPEMDKFLSVAIRNNWIMDSQQKFRIVLNGFDVNKFNDQPIKKNPGKLQ